MNLSARLPRTSHSPTPTVEYEKADVDELARTSLCDSVDELLSLHRSFVAEALVLETRERMSLKAQAKNARRAARKIEVKQMHEELQKRRQESLAAREKDARRRGAAQGRVATASLKKRRNAELASIAQEQSLERESARLQIFKRKSTLESVLHAALLVACFGAIVATSVFNNQTQKNSSELRAIQEKASIIELDAEARVLSLSQEVRSSDELAASEKALLRDKLKVALATLATAEAANRARQEEAGRDERLAQRNARRSSVRSRPAPDKSATRSLQVSASTPFSMGQCAAGDPLCGTL